MIKCYFIICDFLTILTFIILIDFTQTIYIFKSNILQMYDQNVGKHCSI